MDTSTLPAQSSPALPLPPQPRLDLLPTELLQEIIDDLAPIPRSCLEYEGRQRNLLSLCLTCKRLLSFAQPVLFFAIELKTEEEVNAVLRKKELLVHCRWLTLGRMDRLEVLDPDDPRLTAIQVVAEATIRLVGLGCGCDFQMIEPFLGLNLKILCLVDLELPISTHLSLPQLEQLTLHEVRIEDPPTGATQHNLPSLRHVAAGTDHRLPLDDSMSTLLAGLAPQLVSMSADIDAVSIPQASIWNDSALIFQQQCTSDDILLVISRKAHIRFLQVDFQGSFSDDDGRELAAWTELVETAVRRSLSSVSPLEPEKTRNASSRLPRFNNDSPRPARNDGSSSCTRQSMGTSRIASVSRRHSSRGRRNADEGSRKEKSRIEGSEREQLEYCAGLGILSGTIYHLCMIFSIVCSAPATEDD